MQLIPQEHRLEKLLKAGIPPAFAQNIGKVDELAYRVEAPDGAYYYLPTLTDYQILANRIIVPVYDYGESFYVIAQQENVKSIIYFELERDEVYYDYGLNWQLLLSDIMIDYFDSAVEDGISQKTFVGVGSKIGFLQSEALFQLRNLPVEDYSAKFADDKGWRREIAHQLSIV